MELQDGSGTELKIWFNALYFYLLLTINTVRRINYIRSTVFHTLILMAQYEPPSFSIQSFDLQYHIIDDVDPSLDSPLYSSSSRC